MALFSTQTLSTGGRRIDTSRIFDSTRRFVMHRSGRTDWIHPFCMVALGIIGMGFIYSAGVSYSGSYWVKQFIWLCLGAVVYYGVGRIDYKVYLQNALWFYLMALALLVLVLSPVGEIREGAQSWINLGFFNFQPSEAAKIAIMVMVSSVLARTEFKSLGDSIWMLIRVAAIAGAPTLLIFLQPDLGSCLIIPPMLLALLYVSRLDVRFFLAVFGLGISVLSVLAWDLTGYANFIQDNKLTAMEARGKYQVTSWVPMYDYQRERILSFVAPTVVDPNGTEVAWNGIQSVTAVGTGGLLGKGWTEGLQSRLGYLPRGVAHNDFIFAVIGEELGFLGSGLVLGLYALLLGNCLRIAAISRDRFGTLLAVGVAVILLIHVFINIGMTIGLTPITGLPLPFVSYGGSFVLSCCILMGMVQSVHRHRREFA